MYYRKNEVTLFYNKNRELDRKTLAMAMALHPIINKQEINSVHISETLFYMLLDKLGGDVKSIINKSNSFYQSELKGKEFGLNEWYMFIMHQPDLLKAPIAMFHDRAIICDSPANVFRLN